MRKGDHYGLPAPGRAESTPSSSPPPRSWRHPRLPRRRAQSVAALAYGTETIPAVTKITGPGNTFVTAAKALVRGVVETTARLLPEVVVLADDHANPAYVASELLAQAEHDEEAMSVLITPSARLIAEVKDKLAEKSRSCRAGRSSSTP